MSTCITCGDAEAVAKKDLELKQRAIDYGKTWAKDKGVKTIQILRQKNGGYTYRAAGDNDHNFELIEYYIID